MPAKRKHDPENRGIAVSIALRHYMAQLRIERWRAIPALLLPGLGNILVFYTPPLVIALVVIALGRGEVRGVRDLLPYVLLFAAAWLTGEGVWRLGIHFLNRVDSYGMQRLYENAMGFLLEKDLAFFHDNFAGSLTKRTIGYARRYEDFVDTL